MKLARKNFKKNGETPKLQKYMKKFIKNAESNLK